MVPYSFAHEIYMMFFNVFHGDAKTMWGSIALLAVSFMFLVIGASRWVEFLDFGFSRLRKTVLIIIHLIGCLVFALAFAIQAVDLNKKYSNVGMGLLASALVLLFPIHIYLGLLRRIRNRSKTA